LFESDAVQVSLFEARRLASDACGEVEWQTERHSSAVQRRVFEA
jgi:hypothetical protein